MRNLFFENMQNSLERERNQAGKASLSLFDSFLAEKGI